MTSRRVAKTAIDWAAFAERVMESERPFFQALKGRNDSYVMKIAANPENLPKIDWSYYKNNISLPGLVDNFQKSYEALKIPYPGDQGLIAQIDDQEKTMKENSAIFVKKIDSEIVNAKKELEHLHAQIPYSEMMIEEYWIANPKEAIDVVNFPTFFPHDEDCRKFTQDLIDKGKL